MTRPRLYVALRRTLWDYCKQRFAQVTNPAIDPLREAHVMSLATLVGGEFIWKSPVLSQTQVRFLEERLCSAPSVLISLLKFRPASQAR